MPFKRPSPTERALLLRLQEDLHRQQRDEDQLDRHGIASGLEAVIAERGQRIEATRAELERLGIPREGQP